MITMSIKSYGCWLFPILGVIVAIMMLRVLFFYQAEDNLECQGDSSSWDGSSDEESIYTDWLPAPPFPQKSFSGTATNVDYDCHVYIHDLPESALILQKVNDALQKKFKNSKPSSDDNFWFPDSLCIAQYHDDQNWYRGKVLKVKPDNSVEVLMVDYGNVEECRSVDLRKAVVCKNVPIMARKCRISGLMPIHNEWTEPVLDKVHSILVDKEIHVKVVREPTAGDSIYLVDIFLKDIGSVRDYLCANDLATCTPSYDTVDLTLSDEEEPDVLVLEEC